MKYLNRKTYIADARKLGVDEFEIKLLITKFNEHKPKFAAFSTFLSWKQQETNKQTKS